MESKGLYGKKYIDLNIKTRDIKPPDENHVIVKVHACGVCGTDINFVRDWEENAMPLGHEIAGEVVETGKNVKNVKTGDSVIVEDCTMCGVCRDCKSGHPEFCRNMYNMEEQPGMGEYLSVNYNCLDRFEGLDYVSASLTEPLAVSLTSVLNAEIPLGGSVAVLGPGPLGLMSAKIAKLRGAGFVAITGMPADNPREKARLELAGKWGCDLVLESGRQNIEEEIKKVFPDGVDRVIVSSPPQSLSDAFKIIHFGGIITFYGLHFGGKNIINVDVNDMIFRKITLKPTFAEPAINFPVAINLLKNGLLPARDLITHTFGFGQAKETMKAIIEGSMPVIKAVLVP
ncbi:MAG TPA: alcohol dehydrogenase catalytic domain-containing protein [bacterium]|nr:alcohol dehydrogenase catalytic domain-containing protein [bacterium]